MKFALRSTALLLGVSTFSTAALADGAVFGGDLLAGAVRESDAVSQDGEFAGGALPSLKFGGGPVVIQADGLLFAHSGDGVYGGALHAGVDIGNGGFVGVYGSLTSFDHHTSLTTKRVGGEVAFKSGKFAVSGVAGYEHTENAAFYVTTTSTDDVYDVYGRGGKFFSFADIKFMPSSRTSFSVGHRYTGGLHAAAVSAAFGLSDNVSLLFQGRLGEGDYKGAFAGLRFRFGGKDSDAPGDLLDNRLLEDTFATGNTRRTLLDPLPPPDDDGCGSCGGYCET